MDMEGFNHDGKGPSTFITLQIIPICAALCIVLGIAYFYISNYYEQLGRCEIICNPQQHVVDFYTTGGWGVQSYCVCGERHVLDK